MKAQPDELRTHLRSKFFRRQMAQTAVRSLLVILFLPGRDLSPRVEQILKPTQVQALFSDSSVKALDVRVLRRFPGLNVVQLDLLLQAPSQKVPTRPARCRNESRSVSRVAP
jgi:hypothetical protein